MFSAPSTKVCAMITILVTWLLYRLIDHNRAIRSKNSHKFQINMPRIVYFLLIWHFARSIASCWIRFLQISNSFCYAVFEKLDRQALEISKIGVPYLLKFEHKTSWKTLLSLKNSLEKTEPIVKITLFCMATALEAVFEAV